MLETTSPDVEFGLTQFFADSRTRASQYGEHYLALWDALAHAATGGKRIRPTLVLTAFTGLGGRDVALASQVAVSFELLHTAFVIHDDVIDRDLLRRGVANIAGRFTDRAFARGAGPDQAAVWATAAGILAGDLALSEAHRILARLPIASETRMQLLDLLDRAVFISAAGELADVTNALTQHPPGIDEVVATLDQKTAVYSFEAPLQAGAVLASASPEAIDALGRFGRLVGVAFQLTDDLLGIFGDPAKTGKSVTADLREGKQTALLAHARSVPGWDAIAPLVGKRDLTEREAQRARTHLDACGARNAVEQLARDYATSAIDALTESTLPLDLREKLTVLAESSVSRSR
ncbi:polyprenyl synthetase family protein [Cryobacterium sp. MLB-32]|uniref:polyprenyl synthetase family protein n=1 Tax=Cryobacterium sp. MLB-32 TaxID=1529318 RepID=UPI0005623D2D|nr:polyprenyl synthetase family protein [Cryobacterium sp. MLB-32]